MLWASWTTIVPPILLFGAFIAWYLTEQKTARVNATFLGACFLVFWSLSPSLAWELICTIYTRILVAAIITRFHHFFFQHASIIWAGAAVLWLLRRAWQTLWKPVPELINILGVEVPEPPNVSLADIRSDAATIHWSHSSTPKTVRKFLIQVNGVIVGDVAANQEPVIVVSGLKPSHFYNVRIIAVGANNFQAGSRVVRFCTFTDQGKPQLGNSRIPSPSFRDNDKPPAPHDATPDEPSRASASPHDASVAGKGLSAPANHTTTAALGSRRNTVQRRQAPSASIASVPDMPSAPPPQDSGDAAEGSLAELTEQFESTRAVTEEVASTIARDEAENRFLLQGLDAEKLEYKSKQKQKEEQTERLKKEQKLTDRAMRNALQGKAQKQKLLKEKQAERSRMQAQIRQRKNEVEEMKREEKDLKEQQEACERDKDQKVTELGQEIERLQAECSVLEADLKVRRGQVKELEDAQKKRADEGKGTAPHEQLDDLRRRLQLQHQKKHDFVMYESRKLQAVEDQKQALLIQLRQLRNANPALTSSRPSAILTTVFPPIATPAGLATNSSTGPPALDFDHAGKSLFGQHTPSTSLASESLGGDTSAASPTQTPRGSGSSSNGNGNKNGGMNHLHNGPTILRPPASSSMAKPTEFSPGVFMDLPTAANLVPGAKEGGDTVYPAPLSPSAKALLPSSILEGTDDDDDGDDGIDDDGAVTESRQHGPAPAALGQGQAALTDEARSLTTALASPLESAHGIGFPGTLTIGEDMSELRPSKPSGAGNRPSGASSSFRPSMMPTTSVMKNSDVSMVGRPCISPRDAAVVAGPPLSSYGFPTHGQSQSFHGSRLIYGDGDALSPRPASISSLDFARSSVDSHSSLIWGPRPTDSSTTLAMSQSIWQEGWPRGASRQPSMHSSPSALQTSLASPDDEILKENAGANVYQLGAIGSRPAPPGLFAAAARPLPPRLNPTAPAFSGASVLRSQAEHVWRDDNAARPLYPWPRNTMDHGITGRLVGAPLRHFGDVSGLGPAPLNAGSSSREPPSSPWGSRMSTSRESLAVLDRTSSEPTMASPNQDARTTDQVPIMNRLLHKGGWNKLNRSGSGRRKQGSSYFKKSPGDVDDSVTADQRHRNGHTARTPVRTILGRSDVESKAPRSTVPWHSAYYGSAADYPHVVQASGRANKESKAHWLGLRKGQQKENSAPVHHDEI